LDLTASGAETHSLYSGRAAIYNSSGGNVVINVGGSGTTPTIRNAVGSTTTVNNTKNVTLTGLRDLTEVRVFSAGTTTELAGIEDATDGSAGNRSFTFSLAGGTVVDIRIINKQYEYLKLTSYTVPTSDTEVPIQQRFDRNYRNP
jgi:hypothetical protein